MNGSRPYVLAAVGLLLVCGVLLVAGIVATGLLSGWLAPAASTPDFAGTLRAMIAMATPSPGSPASAQSYPSPALSTATALVASAPAAVGGEPSGHIVWTCQMYKYQSSEQICLMNADGSGFRRLTTEDNLNHFYPSLSRQGDSVVYSQYREANMYEIYELRLPDGTATRLTNRMGALTGPEISPDGKSIVFTRSPAASNEEQVWVMDRNGENAHRLVKGTGWDPTWSPDGTKILFATDMDGSAQLYTVNRNGSAIHKITDLPPLRGRSDWSSQDLIVTYSGEAWQRELYIMNADGTNVRQLSPAGGNSQGPSFSPDGQWVAFTGYFDRFNDLNGCEIYIIRIDGSDLRRLTNNDYCDYQPRWGP